MPFLQIHKMQGERKGSLIGEARVPRKKKQASEGSKKNRQDREGSSRERGETQHRRGREVPGYFVPGSMKVRLFKTNYRSEKPSTKLC